MDEERFRLIKLRQGVSAVLFKGSKFLMVAGADWPDGAWCFPQGGIEGEEKHIEAIKRELIEEIGSDKFRILTKSEIDHMYLFPKKIQEKKNCHGQFQTIWFVEFLGEFDEISMDNSELSKFAWFDKEDVVKSMMYPEQKEVFERVLIELTKLQESGII
jgi:putative (di)nucleoside polyphosphate hydrolase